MKSRLALVLVLALGTFLSGTGATLAISGSSGSGSAGSAQYPETCQEEEQSGKRSPGSCSHEHKSCQEEEEAGERSSNSCSHEHRSCQEEEEAGEMASGSCSHEEAEKTCQEEEEAGERSSGSCVQESRQESSGGGGTLPFTGFLAIPVLLVGVGLLGAGVAMRLRMRSDSGGY
jgi:cobalamin biosynthesis Mg chelatase CobN